MARSEWLAVTLSQVSAPELYAQVVSGLSCEAFAALGGAMCFRKLGHAGNCLEVIDQLAWRTQ